MMFDSICTFAHILDLSGELLLFGPWRILLTTIVGLEEERERERKVRELVRDQRRERGSQRSEKRERAKVREREDPLKIIEMTHFTDEF